MKRYSCCRVNDIVCHKKHINKSRVDSVLFMNLAAIISDVSYVWHYIQQKANICHFEEINQLPGGDTSGCECSAGNDCNRHFAISFVGKILGKWLGNMNIGNLSPAKRPRV